MKFRKKLFTFTDIPIFLDDIDDMTDYWQFIILPSLPKRQNQKYTPKRICTIFSKRKISQFNFGFRVDAEDFRQKNWVIRQSRKYFVWDSCTKWNVRFNIGYWHSIYVDSKTLATL